ncbi:hypothetical protein ABVC84_13520 [Xanthomonas euvesicatoria]|uniref:Uncharacterized protein n=1 Tax=Xanthomonas euvesicatoria TaxID=456327 RepID=A0A6B3KIV6_XANEU|nr:hypothetical protein [Xanthomonas euvesicatoria]NEK74664.1 hypothetical protein [Xanthomonas euvesicatoria]NEK91411.1 hypothetical protein [Xanthomonas euvesicatoria]NEL31437.1 hypothetical protein [Xanthomonas euvesicatoria]
MQQRAMRVAQAPHRGFGYDRHGELTKVVSHRQQLAVANQALVVMFLRSIHHANVVVANPGIDHRCRR